jgi:hypothetical protein
MFQFSDITTCLARAATRLRCPHLALLLAGVVLPNLLSIATALSLIDIGLPSRTFSILLYGLVALLAALLPPALTCVLFLVVLAFDLIWTISQMFGLGPGDLIIALDYAGRIDVLASPLYVGLICIVTATSIVSLNLLARKSVVKRGNTYLLCVGVLLVSAVESTANSPANLKAGTRQASQPSIESAVQQSGLMAATASTRRNVVVVMVESLGYFNDKDAREAIAAPLRQARITEQYAVSSGKVAYAGSTTAGEMRELCGTSLPYGEVASDPDRRCLPQLLKQAGYATLAFHGFSHAMFARTDWYPRIGFGESYFVDDLAPEGHRRCGGTFRGACDADLAPEIVRRAARSGAPRLIYWLTLNTHVPIAPTDARTDFDCGDPASKFGTMAVCRMAELWHDVFTAVADLSLDPAIAPAEILIVGDHAPPLWSKRGRGQFEPGQVAWYRLSPKDVQLTTRGNRPLALEADAVSRSD